MKEVKDKYGNSIVSRPGGTESSLILQIGGGERLIGLLHHQSRTLYMDGREWFSAAIDGYGIPYEILKSGRRFDQIVIYEGQISITINRTFFLENCVFFKDSPEGFARIAYLKQDMLEQDEVPKPSSRPFETTEIREYFKKNGYPKGEYALKQGVTIVDTKKFVEVSLIDLEGNDGSSRYERPYYDLLKFYNLIRNGNESTKQK